MKKHSLGQLYWNAHQVYAWVYTRNPRLVVLLSDRDKGDSVEPSVIDFFAMGNRPGADFADYAEAQEAIVSTLQEGRLRSWGRREGVGTLEEIPPLEWVDLHFVWYVFQGWAEAVSMTDNPPSSIVGAPRWYGLKFKRDDVLELWPPTETEIEQAEPAKADQAQTDDERTSAPSSQQDPAPQQGAPEPDPYRTGFPGRPSIKHLIDEEFQNRVANKTFDLTLLGEAEELHNWAEKTHPDAARPTVKSILNMIRDEHRRAKSLLPKPIK